MTPDVATVIDKYGFAAGAFILMWYTCQTTLVANTEAVNQLILAVNSL